MKQYSDPILAIYFFKTEIVVTQSLQPTRSIEEWEESYGQSIKKINYKTQLNKVNLVLNFSE